MTCVRCRGLMIGDSFEDLHDDTHQFRFTGWRCLNCGEVLDPVIVEYRQVRRSKAGLRFSPAIMPALASCDDASARQSVLKRKGKAAIFNQNQGESS